MFQEVIFGRTRRIVPELESWPVQELLDIPHRLMISIDTPEPLVPILHDLKQVLFRTAF